MLPTQKSPALATIEGLIGSLTLPEILWLIQHLVEQITNFLPNEVMGMSLKHAKMKEPIPTMTELLEELHKINRENPIEFDLPERVNLPMPFEVEYDRLLV